MAERSYFSLRYSIPGFSFIIIIFILNFDILSQYLPTTEKQVFLAFISLIGGFPFGFLISQITWFIHQYFVLPFFMNNVRISLITRFHDITHNRFRLLTFYNYIVHTVSQEDTRIYEYQTRRYDIITVIWNVIFSFNIALIFGFVIRYYFFPQILQIRSRIYYLDSYIIWMRIFVLIISFMFLGSNFYAKRQYDDMAEAIIIKTSNNYYYKLKRIFPTYFHEVKTKRTLLDKICEYEHGYYIIEIIVMSIFIIINIILNSILLI